MNGFLSPPRKPRVVDIDANKDYAARMVQVLSPYFDTKGYSDSRLALDALEADPPDAIVLNERVLPWGVFSLLDEIKRRPSLAGIPIICTSESEVSNFFDLVKERGIAITFKKPIIIMDLVIAIHTQIGGKVEESWKQIEPVQQSALIKTVSAFNNLTDLVIEGAPLPYGTIRESCEPLITAVRNNNYKDMLQGVRQHDNYTYVHSLRVATFLSLFGHKIGIEGDALTVLATGGLIHDIGKMAIPFAVLNKQGKLNDEEWVIMKSHVDKTLTCLHNSPDIPRAVLIIASQHHEKLNGKGYPRGLRNGELNDLARMATIVDIFGALTDRRVYKEPIPPETALDMMSQMNDELDQHFLGLFKEMLLEAASVPLAA